MGALCASPGADAPASAPAAIAGSRQGTKRTTKKQKGPKQVELPQGKTLKAGWLWFKQKEKFKKRFFIRFMKPDAEPGMTQEEADEILILVAMEGPREDSKVKSTLLLRKCLYADTANHVIRKYEPEFALTIKTDSTIWELRADAGDVMRGWFNAIYSRITGRIVPTQAGFLNVSADKTGHFRHLMFRLLPTDKNGFSEFMSFTSAVDEMPIDRFFVANLPNTEKTALARLLDDQQNNEKRGFDPSSTAREFAFDVHLMYEPNHKGGYLSQKKVAFRAASREDTKAWISAILKAANAARGSTNNQAFDGTRGLTSGAVEEVFSSSEIDIDVNDAKSAMEDLPSKWRKASGSAAVRTPPSAAKGIAFSFDNKHFRRPRQDSGADIKHRRGKSGLSLNEMPTATSDNQKIGKSSATPIPPPPTRPPRDERSDSFSTIMSAPDLGTLLDRESLIQSNTSNSSDK